MIIKKQLKYSFLMNKFLNNRPFIEKWCMPRKGGPYVYIKHRLDSRHPKKFQIIVAKSRVKAKAIWPGMEDD